MFGKGVYIEMKTLGKIVHYSSKSASSKRCKRQVIGMLFLIIFCVMIPLSTVLAQEQMTVEEETLIHGQEVPLITEPEIENREEIQSTPSSKQPMLMEQENGLTEDDHVLNGVVQDEEQQKVEENEKDSFLLQEGNFQQLASDPANHVFDIAEGAITISKGTNVATLKVVYGTPAATLDNIPVATEITIKGTSTSNKVAVDGTSLGGDQINITLDNVSIGNLSNPDANGFLYCAFSITNANVQLNLVGANVLQSCEKRAGLRVAANDNGKVTITSSTNGSLLALSNGWGAGIGGNPGLNGGDAGTITVQGGTVEAYSTVVQGKKGYGAGIGGGGGTGELGGIGATITIQGGTVIAGSSKNGEGWAAGIGGGYGTVTAGGKGGTVQISGGTVTAYCSSNSDGFGAGIGGGGASKNGGNGGTVKISGGRVTAFSSGSGTGYGAGIGGGSGEPVFVDGFRGLNGETTISGGVVLAYCSVNGMSGTDAIGEGFRKATDSLPESGLKNIFEGGSIYLKGKNRTGGAGAFPAPVGYDTTTPVYLNVLTFADAPQTSAVVTAGSINGVNCVVGVPTSLNIYGIKDVWTDAESKVYFWLPASGNAAQMVNLTANGALHTNTFIRANNNSTTAILRSGVNVLFDSQGGSAVAGGLVFFNSAITEPMVPDKTGYTFLGWYDAPSGGVAWVFSTLMEATTPNPLTLYARWKPIPIEVQFDSQGGSTVISQTIDYDTTLTPPMNPSRTGYYFGGWYDAPSGGNLWDFATHITTPMTLYARWSLAPITVQFDSQGGSGIDTQTVDYGATLNKPSDSTKKGYTFLGWYNAPSGGRLWEFATPITASMTLYAHWQPIPVTVQFDFEDGRSIIQIVDYGTLLVQPKTPGREGYTFLGWFDAPNGGNKWDFATPIKSSITLYAHWELMDSSTPSQTAYPANKVAAKTGEKSSFIRWNSLLMGVAAVFVGILLKRIWNHRKARTE